MIWSLRLLLFCLVLTSIQASAANLVVTSLADSGPGTLRNQIAAASAGDRIEIRIAGVIQLSSQININKTLEIAGAFPIHTKINVQNATGTTNYAFLVSANNVNITGISFINSALSPDRGSIHINANGCLIKDCVFEGTGSSWGAVYVEAGSATFNACSFINNTGNSDGGALYLNTGSTGNVSNCTFSGNQSGAGSNAGGIRVSNATANLINNTFKDNISGNVGDDISVVGASSSVFLQNNLFMSSSSNSFFTSGGTVTSGGGNIHGALAAGWTPDASDLIGAILANVAMEPLKTDGFGIKYYPIGVISIARNAGTTNSLTTDCRRAPRVMDDGSGTAKPDAGAFEYTPYRVTNFNALGPGSLSAAIGNVNAASTGPFFIEFTAAAPGTISLSAALPSLNKTVTIDGFSQTGSAIMGPGAAANGLTPLVPGCVIDGGSSIATGIQINAAGSASKIHGLTLLHFSAQGIVLTSTSNVVIAGNKIAGNDMGVEIQFGNNNVVGDSGYFKMNVISSNTSRGILINGSTNNFIRNNLIGTSDDGSTGAGIGQNVGVEVVSATSIGNLIGGMYSEEEGNIISGNSVHQILLTSNSQSTAIKGNMIGTAYDGQTPISSAAAYGITSTVSSGLNIIGGPNSKERNIIVGQGNAGVFLNGSNNNTLQNNYIGFTITPLPVQIPNLVGIQIDNGSTLNNIGTTSARNYVSGNTNQGIFITTGSQQNTVIRNFIGLSHMGTSLSNGAAGLLLNNAPNNVIGNANGGNFISGNNGHGISIISSRANILMNNFIGTDTLGTSPNSNSLNGIDISNSNLLQISGNFVNASGQHGINLVADSCTITNNIIGSDATLSVPMGNSQNGIIVNGHLNQIGNTFSGGNSICYNGNFATHVGVGIGISNGNQNSILGNSIFKNAGLGIDIELDGVTPNDPSDGDGGTNNGQNYPDSLYISNCNGVTNIKVVYQAIMGETYRLELFQNPSGSGNGDVNGEGKTFITSFSLIPSVTGTNVFTTAYASTLSFSDSVSATLSRSIAAGGYFETSEFSLNVAYLEGISSHTSTSDNITCFGGTDGWVVMHPVNGVSPYTYTWYNSINTSIGQDVDSATNLSAGIYYGIITDATGCQDTTVNITVIEPPVLTFGSTFSDPLCFGECTGSITITAGGGTAPYTYSQDGTTFQVSNAFTNLCAGVYNTLVLKDTNGCMLNLAAISLTDPTPIVITATPSDEICAGACDGSITATNTGGIGTIEFDLSGSGTFTTSSVLTNLCAGSFDAIVRDGNGCKDSMTVTINPGYSLIVSAGSDQTVCSGGSATLNGSVTSGTANTINWFVSGNASIIGSALSQSVSPTVATTYVLEVTGGPSCVARDTVEVTIGVADDPNIVYPLATLDTVLACQTGTNLIPNITTPGGTFSSSSAGISLVSTSGEINFNASTMGQYTVYYTTAGCPAIDSVVVFVLPTPAAPTPVTPTSFTICGGTPIPTMSIDPNLTAGAILWATDASLTNIGWIGYNYTPGTVSSGLNDYFVFERYNNCQSPSVEFDIYNIDNSLLNDGSPYSTCPDIPVTISVSASTGTISNFVWSPGSAVTDSTASTTTITPSATTVLTYDLTLLGCALTGSITIDVSTDPNCAFENIYTAFSPEGDGVNDTWIIEGVITNPINKVFIYNRWGDLLQEFENYDNVNVVWDGTYKGELLPSGTYYYVIVYTELDRQYSGWVQLTR